MTSNFQTGSSRGLPDYVGGCTEDEYLLDSQDQIGSEPLFKELDQDFNCNSGGSQKQSTQRQSQRGTTANINILDFSHTEEDSAIQQWKDSRLKKLEDFTKDLGRNSSQKRHRREPGGSELTTLKHNSNDYVTLSSHNVGGSFQNETTNQTQHNQLPVILNATTSLGETQNYDTEQKDNTNPYEEDDGDETIEDDLMLTKTEGSAMLKFGSAVCSTQRSIQMKGGGEFEKRICDIKSKLTQIKNTINNEIENSFNQQLQSDYNSNSQKGDNFSPQLVNHQARIEYQNYGMQKQASNSKAQSSVVSSVDHFQNRLNHIKQSIAKNYQEPQPQIRQEDERDRFNRIKSIIDSSFHQKQQTSTQKSRTGVMPQPSLQSDDDFQQQRLMSIPISLDQTASVKHQYQATLNSVTSEVQKENDQLKQKLQLLSHTEQALTRKMDQLYSDQRQEKQLYEEQLQKMQNEIAKMCDVIQDLTKKKRSQSKRTCAKRQRIANLEKQIRELQMQLLNNGNNSATAILMTQNFTETQTSQKQEKSKHLELPKKQPGDKEKLELQVSHLEEKMKKFHRDLQDNGQSQLLRDQLAQQLNENEQIRDAYAQQYNEMLANFEAYKQETEARFAKQEAEFREKEEQLIKQHGEEQQRKQAQIEYLKRENQTLRDKIGKIRDVFDHQRSPRRDENFNRTNHTDLHPFNETINLQFNDENMNMNKNEVDRENKRVMSKQHSKKKLSSTKQPRKQQGASQVTKKTVKRQQSAKPHQQRL